MRSFLLLSTIYAAIVGTSSALVDAGERTTVVVSASGYDPRTSYPGCSPDGCIPDNTRDNDRSTRWSCKGDTLDNDKGCWIKYKFGEPQDLEQIRTAFCEGNEDTRTLKLYLNGKYHSKITSSGKTNYYQTFDLATDETSEIKIYLDDYTSNSDVWLSLTEVKLMVE